jgi:hypothetical protein
MTVHTRLNLAGNSDNITAASRAAPLDVEQSLVLFGRVVPRALLGVLFVSLLLNVTAIWWGVQSSGSTSDWADDSASPWEVTRCVAGNCADAWPNKYPPFHAYVVAAVYGPAFGIAKLTNVDLDTSPADTVLGLLGRGVTLLMAMGVLLLVYACSREMGHSQRAGVFAVAIAAFTPQFVYYSKMMNLDVPYTFWFMLSLLVLLRILKEHRLRDYIAFAIAATCAIATKDQAYAFYVLPGPFVAVAAYRYFRTRYDDSQAAFRQVLIRFSLATLTAIVLYALVWDVFFHPEWLLQHVRTITGPRSAAYRVYEPSLSGEIGLLVYCVRLLAFALQWPFLVLTVTGVAVALLTARRNLIVLMPLIVIVSYYLSFIGLVGYAFDRFLLPVTLVLGLYGGWFLHTRMEPDKRRWLKIAVLAVFGYMVVYSASVNMLLLADGRYEVREWMKRNVPRSAVVTSIGIPGYLPNTSGFNEHRLIARPNEEKLRALDPEYVIVSDSYLRAFPLTQRGRALFEGLANGTAGFELVYTTAGKPLYNLLRPAPNSTNLDKVNPRIWIYRAKGSSNQQQ